MGLLGKPFGRDYAVEREPSILRVSSLRTLGSLLHQMEAEAPDWVVVFRAHGAAPEGRYLYALRPDEIRGLDTPRTATLEVALDLHEETASGEARSGRPVVDDDGGWWRPRFVELDADGSVVAIFEAQPLAHAEVLVPAAKDLTVKDAELDFDGLLDDLLKEFSVDAAPRAADDDADASVAEESGDDGGGGAGVPYHPLPRWSEDDAAPLDLGPARGPSPSPPGLIPDPSRPGGITESLQGMLAGLRDDRPPAKVDLTLSAEAPAEACVGAAIDVSWRVERSEGSRPLAHHLTASAEAETPVVVVLTMQGGAVERIGESVVQVAPPGPQRPASGAFRLRAVGTGRVRMAIAFLQNGRQLGSIGLVIEIVEDAPRAETTSRRVAAEPRGGDDTLLLKISGVKKGDDFHYEYFLLGQRLGMLHTFVSAPLKDAGDGRARTELDFVHRIYDRVSPNLGSRADLVALQKDLRRLGRFLCHELVPEDARRRLWPLRDRIAGIQVVSFEPYIPWELLQLENPDTQESDDRFLAEYSLVRTIDGRNGAQTLRLDDWRFLFADFPHNLHNPVGQSERAFFLDPDPKLASSASLAPVVRTPDDLLQTLSEGAFDVLHLSCHAESDHSRIETARLIIGDRQGADGTIEEVAVDTVAVRGEARLRSRAPLVFLNACDTGREGAVLTSWGGWPGVFMEQGAGAFVGASWPVRDKPATAFATAFYRSLLSDLTLAQSAQAARLAAKALGDASWLAYKVYGDPLARRA